MASIYGFKLKNIKTFPGRDWEGVTADLWYNGKKIAQYADYGDGADGTLEYEGFREGQKKYESILNEAIKKLADDERFGEYTRETLKKTDYFMGDAIFIDELLDLTDKEKQFKKIQKKGFACIAFYRQTGGMYYAAWFASKDDEQIEKFKTQKGIEQFRLYTSIDEFDIK